MAQAASGTKIKKKKKSVLKRARQSVEKEAINRANRTQVRTIMRRLRTALSEGDVKTSSDLLKPALSALDHAIAKGVLHENTGNRYKSRLALSFNSGFAFSLFSGRAVIITVLLTVAVAVLAVVVARVRTVPQAIGGGLVLGGAVGNLSERLISGHHGQVADFITLTHWPTFNLADACVTVGVVVVAITLVLGGAQAQHAKP